MAVVDDVREALEQTVPDFSDRSGDWAGVLAMAQAGEGNRRGRDGSFQGRRRRRLIALAAAVLVVVVATASALGVRAYFLDKGFIGLPPEGATPSSPETGQLVLSAYGPGGGSRTHIWVYADGRVISQRQFDRPRDALPEGANELSSGFLEQRLTVEGVERLRAEAISTGLFAHDSVLNLQRTPCFNYIEVSNGDGLVRVTWHGSQCPPVPGDPAATTATKVEESELLQLVDRLTNPTTWLPASAWQQRESRAYVPSRFAIEFGARPDTLEPSRILALLPDPAEELLAAKPRARLRHFYGGTGVPLRRVYDYRLQVTVDEARTLVEALDRAGLERKPTEVQAYTLTYVRGEVPPEGPGAFFFVTFEPILPHGESVCSGCG